MQWSQIKTLFILCFLILDVYLLFQFTTKQQESDHDVLKQEAETTVQDSLDAENITVPDDLSDEEIKGTYITVEQQNFTEEEIDKVKAVKGQQTAVIDQKLIVSKMKEPIPIAKDATKEEVAEQAKMKFALISPDSYMLWDWNKDHNMLIFFQKKNDRPIYFNQNGMLLVFINDKNEITSYTQTLLGEEEPQDKEELLIKPINAIYTLYQKNELYSGEEVTKVDIGYHTRIAVEDGPQIFAPTWKVTLKSDRTYFVNAIEGLINASNGAEFLEKSMSTIIGKVSTMTKSQDLKEHFLTILKQRYGKLKQVNRGETK